MIITISGLYGSGGQEIGVKLAEILGYKMHDKELFRRSEEAEKIDFKGETSRYYDENQDLPEPRKGYDRAVLALQMDVLPLRQYDDAEKLNDFSYERQKMVAMQNEVITGIAAEDNVIIMGRCANYVLKDNPNCISVFTRDSLDSRIERIMGIYNTDENLAASLIRKTDKRRADYYEYITQRAWGIAEDYDISINCGLLGIWKTAELIAGVVKTKEAV